LSPDGRNLAFIRMLGTDEFAGRDEFAVLMVRCLRWVGSERKILSLTVRGRIKRISDRLFERHRTALGPNSAEPFV